MTENNKPETKQENLEEMKELNDLKNKKDEMVEMKEKLNSKLYQYNTISYLVKQDGEDIFTTDKLESAHALVRDKIDKFINSKIGNFHYEQNGNEYSVYSVYRSFLMVLGDYLETTFKIYKLRHIVYI